ncbi:hypothetical protein C2S51_022578 [Perilla frutescens var. frutescens]|nr:hypothetical protein C2S51_022578 [Perilla frutescens var. frutescens]
MNLEDEDSSSKMRGIALKTEVAEDVPEHTYKEMYEKWLEVAEINKTLQSHNKDLLKENEEFIRANAEQKVIIQQQKNEIEELSAELKSIKRNVNMLNNEKGIIYYYYEEKGHIRPHCEKYLFDLKRMRRRFVAQHSSNTNKRPAIQKSKKPAQKKQWVVKQTSMISHTFLRVENKGNWYFDSGYSRHMTRDFSVVQNLKACSSDFVTFGDGKSGKVMGQVVFTNESYKVMNKNNDLFMKGKRSADNCYQLHVPTQYSLTCQRTSIEESEIWHQKLGHINFRNLQKIISKEVVRELPQIKIDRDKVDEYHGFGMVPLADLTAEDVHITAVSSSSESDNYTITEKEDSEYENDGDNEPVIPDPHSEGEEFSGTDLELSSASEEEPPFMDMILIKNVKAGAEVFNT